MPSSKPDDVEAISNRPKEQAQVPWSSANASITSQASPTRGCFAPNSRIILNRAKDAAPHLRMSISIAKKYGLAGYIYASELMEGVGSESCKARPRPVFRQAEAALEALKGHSFAPMVHLPIRIAIVGRGQKALPLATLRER